MSILSCLYLIQCSNNSGSEKAEHIQELDSLTVYPADSEPAYEVDLVQEQSFGGGNDPREPYLITITSCAVDDNDRVIIRGQNNDFKTELHVYNPDGSYRMQIGRSGRGPGEYEFVSNNFQINAGRVFLQDQSTKRLSFFSADDYSFEKTTNLQDWNVRDLEAVRDMKLSDFRARSDGNLLAIFSGLPTGSGRTANTKFMLVDTEGNVLNPEPLIELPSPFYIVNENRGNTLLPLRMQLSLMGRSLYVLSHDNAIYTVSQTEDFLIKKYDAEGIYQFAIYYPVMGPPFDVDSVRLPGGHSQLAIKNALEEADVEIPETAPVLHNMRIDDENRIWVTVAVDTETSEWWMLGESGELLAKIIAPENEAICDIQNGYLYTKSFDSKGSDDPEGWESKVVKYSINLTER
ncbi:6-bladed beta-propeller [Rhodohalobacter sp. WB101]|uniref:6-bladed beta-propeller n=1 Tax=Rhodohalobacter sulfatireducens TaxID=2911366 RepID=A0ABS9KBK5_9BACT|nr:6-bladed beta-propeller [Rhodohalobacter sulfatireducens]